MAASIEVRPATADELPAIYALRDSFFASRSLPAQPMMEGTFWIVSVHAGDVLACQGIIEDPQARQLLVTDTYCGTDRRAKVALKRLGDFVHDHADRTDCEMFGNILPDDPVWHGVAERHGYAVVAHVVHRKRRSERLADASSNTPSDRGGDDGRLEHAEQSGAEKQRKPASRRGRQRKAIRRRGVRAAAAVLPE